MASHPGLVIGQELGTVPMDIQIAIATHLTTSDIARMKVILRNSQALMLAILSTVRGRQLNSRSWWFGVEASSTLMLKIE